MKKITILHIVLIALTVLSLTSIAAKDGPKDGLFRFTTRLTGAAEVNAQGVPNQGDPDGKGQATITINFGQGTLCWDIFVSGITLPASAAHVHEAPVGVAGPVVVGLSAPDASGSASGCTSVSRDELKEIIQHPQEYYVNVHNSDYPNGALRGQLAQ
jgi:CHRD domain-containing protein